MQTGKTILQSHVKQSFGEIDVGFECGLHLCYFLVLDDNI